MYPDRVSSDPKQHYVRQSIGCIHIIHICPYLLNQFANTMNRLMQFFHGATDFADVAVSVTLLLGARNNETSSSQTFSILLSVSLVHCSYVDS